MVVEQFNDYAIADDVNVNGKLTLGENIADLGGITISFDAMHEATGDDVPAMDGLTATSNSSSPTPRCGG